MSAPVSPTRASRGPYAKSAQTRRRIVEAATTIFSEHGYHGGSTAAIAALAGLSSAQLFYYFATKSDMLMAVLDDRDRIADQITGALPDNPSEIPRAILRIATANAQIPEQIRLYMVLFAESSVAEHPLREYYTNRYRRLEREFLAAFTQVQDAGLLRVGVDVDYAAASTLALWDGAQLQWLVEPSRVDVVTRLWRHLSAITHVQLVDPDEITAEPDESPGEPDEPGADR